MRNLSSGIYLPLGMEGFELCHPIKQDDFEKIYSEIDGVRKSEAWVRVPVQLIHEDENKPLAQSDSPWLGAHALIFREKAISPILDMLVQNGELLPLSCDEESLVIYNPIHVIDALDEPASSIVRFADGKVMFIKKYGFLEKVVENVDIFKIPNLRVSPTFFSHRFVEKWNASGLSGLEFKKIWPQNA